MFFNTEQYQETFTASKKFSAALQQFPSQIFRRDDDINLILQSSLEVRELEKQSLSKSEAWKGFKWKAECPHKYIPVTETAIVPGSRKPTPFGDCFMRLTIQPSFVTRNLVVVKENVFILENENRILFLGIEVDPIEAEKYLHSFDPSLLAEKPALFHVEHAVVGTEERPIATWQMVRLCDKDLTDSDEAEIISKIRNRITNTTGVKIYLQTINQLIDEQTFTPEPD